MKKSVLALAGTLTLFLSAPQFTTAQDATAQGSSQNHAGRYHRSPDEVVDMLDSKLSLSDDQKAKIKPIIEERQQKIQALSDSSGRRRKKAREMKSIFGDSDKKINAVLNDGQRQKYKEIEDQMREQAKARWHDRNSQN